MLIHGGLAVPQRAHHVALEEDEVEDGEGEDGEQKETMVTMGSRSFSASTSIQLRGMAAGSPGLQGVRRSWTTAPLPSRAGPDTWSHVWWAGHWEGKRKGKGPS